MRHVIIVVLLATLTIAAGCGKEETPSRDYYPVLNSLVYDLQVAVKDSNRAAIDSLMSADILDKGLTSDSLISFAYGPNGRYDFQQFGNCVIVHTDKRAQIDCFVMDTTLKNDRPIRFNFKRDDTLWLLTDFKTPTDTVFADSIP